MKKLENRVALITGGSRGIGKSIAFALAGEGADIGLTYITNKDIADENCKNIRKKFGVKAIAMRVDLADPAEIAKMAETMFKEFGKVDILVNNAATWVSKPLAETSLEEFKKVIDTDLTAVFLCTKAVLPSMLSHGWGRIINISATFGLTGQGGDCAYCTAKGGVVAFTKVVAREVARQGVIMNCVAPGMTLTDVQKGLSPAALEAAANKFPLGRISRPEEIANAVLFLAAPGSEVFVGQTLCPNNGEYMVY